MCERLFPSGQPEVFGATTMAKTYAYDLSNLPGDHPACYSRELETWADCLAERTGKTTGQAIVLRLRARPDRSTGRATRDDLILSAAPHSTQQELAGLKRTLPATAISERGGLAVAAVVLSVVLQFRIREVTLKGESGDFWLEDQAGVPRGLCEMSGSRNNNLSTLYGGKRSQVLRNQAATECYVSVTRYASRESYFCRVR